jgi:hypothetical protein
MAPYSKMAAEWAQNDHFHDVLDSKLGQVSPMWIKHHINMSHYPITKVQW